jgi:hypothetical protein
LDVHTARWIVDKCFKGDLIRGRTVLLVVSCPFARSAVFVIPLQTHNVAMASPIAEYVVSLGPDGRIACRGSVSDALKKDKRLAAELVEGARAIKDDEKKIDQEEPNARAKQADGKLILAEEIAEGHVSRDACNCCLPPSVSHDAHPVRKVKLFINSLGGSHVILFWILFVCGLLFCDGSLAVQTWFMGYWAEQYDIYPPEEVNITL